MEPLNYKWQSVNYSEWHSPLPRKGFRLPKTSKNKHQKTKKKK